MGGIRQLLCAVDFSDVSRRALDHAIALATWYRARLTVMYVHHVPLAAMVLTSLPAPPTMQGMALSGRDREELKRALEQFLPAGASTHIAVECLVAEGEVAPEIVARSASADMVVIGTHGRSGYQHLLLGSVAEKVVRTAACPVLTVPRAAAEATAVAPALFRHVLVAMDFSKTSLRALTCAVSLAPDANARLTLLEVVELPPELDLWAMESAEGRAQVERWKAHALTRLRASVPEAVRARCTVDERVETGLPYREILRVSAERPVDLIVLGAHGRNAIERMFYGSTAQHVVREAICPVLTVRDPAP